MSSNEKLSGHTIESSQARARRLALLCFLPLLLWLAPSAQAYLFYNYECGPAHWNADPSFGFLQGSFGNAFERAAVIEPAHRINAVGGQWLDFQDWTVYGDDTPDKDRNEIWKVDDLGENVRGLMTFRSRNCVIQTADIRFADHYTWRHGEPGDYGLNFWMTVDDENSFLYLRQTALHELLHATGLEHEDNAYAYTNYEQMPWSNSPEGHLVEPLPDDRRGLRTLYGDGGSELDVAVLNTHHLDNPGAEAIGFLNCSPSTGTWFSNLWFFGGSCGNSFETEVCPGDWIFVTYNIANYGTQTANTTHRLWFSSNSIWSGNDYPSSTVWQSVVSKDAYYGRYFAMPNIPPGDYWPIIKIDTNLDESSESTINNRIPLPGMITMASDCDGASGGYQAP